MDITYFKVNEDILNRYLEIRSCDNKPIKKGFTKWLFYIRNYKEIKK